MINSWLLFEGGNGAVRIPIEEEDVDAGGNVFSIWFVLSLLSNTG